MLFFLINNLGHTLGTTVDKPIFFFYNVTTYHLIIKT